jgi:hypothetical protein
VKAGAPGIDRIRSGLFDAREAAADFEKEVARENCGMTLNRAFASTPQLATVPGGGGPRRLHTTFSSFEYETLQAVRDGARWMSLLYVAGSVLLGYVAVWLGAALTARR